MLCTASRFVCVYTVGYSYFNNSITGSNQIQKTVSKTFLIFCTIASKFWSKVSKKPSKDPHKYSWKTMYPKRGAPSRSTHSYSNGLKINVLYINCSIDQQIIVEVLRKKSITLAPWINCSILQLFVEVKISCPFVCSTDQQKYIEVK